MLSNVDINKRLSTIIGNATDGNPPIRPASIDLSVGVIYVPPVEDTALPEITDSFVLPVGGTLVAETDEHLSLPSDLCGLMFPKSSALAEKGILVTNFGVVDPGFNGKLKFVMINLGRKPFGIRKGDKVVTLAFIELGTKADPDYQEYIVGRPRGLSAIDSSRMLSHDLVDVVARASEVAAKEVRSSILGMGIVLTLFLVVPTLILALAPPFLAGWVGYGPHDSRMDELEERISEQDAVVKRLIDSLEILSLENER